MANVKQPKILILGANGILGSQLVEVFSGKNVTAWTRKDLDITKAKQVEDKITKLNPEILINAAAFTDVDGSEKKKAFVKEVNGSAVGNLAKVCRKIDCLLVHYSTDYVFSGNKPEGYKESYKTSAINAYGQSKELGEKLLRKYCRKYYLIRTSWLFGKNGRNFIDSIKELAPRRVEMKVVNDQYGKPTYAKDLAHRTKDIIEKKQPFGIYHLTNEGVTTWYKLAKEICRIQKYKTRVVPVTSYQFPRPARRPT
ncbi:dTDP-4-dehydrorhamnose reductase, partial [Patescibacteria group bacterium]|nr:dTDP-4-dehydrorhamnose reductase [Patescibacteria group bacterium]